MTNPISAEQRRADDESYTCFIPVTSEAEDENHWTAPCPRCGLPAEHGRYEDWRGSVNVYHTVACDHCGHRSDFDWLTP